MGKKKKGVLAVVSALMLCSFAGAYASHTVSVSVKNRLSTGVVDIALKEYQKNPETGEDEPYRNDKTVVPGEEVSKIPEVACLEAPCYVRCSVAWETTGTEGKQGEEAFCVKESDLRGISGDWVRRGEYWYYTKVLQKNDKARFFEGIRFPGDYTEAVSGQTLDIAVRAEGVQAAHLHPDFRSESPWGAVGEIVKCTKTRDGRKEEREVDRGNMKVCFKGTAGDMVSSVDDFFAAFDEFMPGDTKEGTLTVDNTTKDMQDMFLSIESDPSNGQEEKELLSRISLVIRNDGHPIFRGTMAEAEKRGEFSLGRYKEGAETEVSYSLHLPPDVDNALSLADTAQVWTFRATVPDEKVPDIEETEYGKEDDTKTADSKNGMAQRPDSRDGDAGRTGNIPVFAPKTGDYTDAMGIVAVMVLSLGILGGAIVWRKERRQE